MIRKASLLVAGALVAAFAVFNVTQQALPQGGLAASAQEDDTYAQLNLFGEVLERIRADYVDEVDTETLIQAAIDGMIQSLDPHSGYLDSDAFSDMQVETMGSFGGLGLQVETSEDLVRVVSPIDDTPAQRAGILPGDLITAIDGDPVSEMDLDQAVDRMRGPPNTSVTLTIRRGEEADFDVTIVRAIIRFDTVSARVEGDILYIRVAQFTESTASELGEHVAEAMAEIGANPVTGAILDLRNNPGGLYESSIAVSDAFLEQGEIVSTRGRNPQDTQRRAATEGDIVAGLPMVVLVNGGTASAAEIVAGALQDQRRATLVGTHSFGKGSVQTIFSLGPDAGALRLTTSRYYTPSGTSIQARGIVPDIEILQELPPELQEQAEATPVQGEASLEGHLEGEGDEVTVSAAESYIPPDPVDDSQFNYALRLLRGEEQHASFPPDPDALPL